MDHDFYKEKISAFFDGDLKNETFIMVSEHLKECEICQHELEKLTNLDKMIEEHSRLSENEYWERSAQRIESAITEEENEEKVTEIKPFVWKGLGWKLTTVAASIALITFIAIYEKDMSDEMYEIIEPDSVSVHEIIYEESKVEENQKKDDTIYEKPLKRSLEAESVPQKAEDLKMETNVQTPLVTLADDAISDDNIIIDEVEGQRIQAPSEKISETERQPSVAEDIEKEIEKIGEDDLSKESFTLSQWREKRDKLLSTTEGIKMPELKQSFAKMKTSSSSTITSKDKDIILNLLECHYNIALLTKDSVEYNKAFESIEKYSLSDTEEYKKQAIFYMEELSKIGDK